MWVEIVTTSAFECPWCIKAKALLDSYCVKYDEFDISTSESAKNTMRHYGLKTIPQIWINDQHIGGYNELVEYYKRTFT